MRSLQCQHRQKHHDRRCNAACRTLRSTIRPRSCFMSARVSASLATQDRMTPDERPQKVACGDCPPLKAPRSRGSTTIGPHHSEEPRRAMEQYQCRTHFRLVRVTLAAPSPVASAGWLKCGSILGRGTRLFQTPNSPSRRLFLGSRSDTRFMGQTRELASARALIEGGVPQRTSPISEAPPGVAATPWRSLGEFEACQCYLTSN